MHFIIMKNHSNFAVKLETYDYIYLSQLNLFYTYDNSIRNNIDFNIGNCVYFCTNFMNKKFILKIEYGKVKW